MYCSPRDTRSRAHCDRLTVTEYTMCVSYCTGRLLGPITGGTCIVHPGTRAPEHTATDLLSQNIRCVCRIARGGLLGPITGGTCIVHPGTRAPEHTATDLLSQNIRCVCHIAWADFWGLLPGTPTLFTPGHAAPEGPATCLPSKHILCVIDGLYCVLLTG